MRVIITTIIVCLSMTHAISQPQWKFHIAFEDATGAKDTIWYIWDTTATFYGADTALGEITAELDPESFNVWTHNYGLTWYDTIQIVAHPFEYFFEHRIYANNFQLPIDISWDTSLFYADSIPPLPVGYVNYATMDNHYFFFYNNNDYYHHLFDMAIDNQAVTPDPTITDPWFWQDWVNMPVRISIAQHTVVNLEELKEQNVPLMTACPNPFNRVVTIQYKLQDEAKVEISIHDLHGNRIATLVNKMYEQGNHTINWTGTNDVSQAVAPGLYIAYLKINGTIQQSVKIIKH